MNNWMVLGQHLPEEVKATWHPYCTPATQNKTHEPTRVFDKKDYPSLPGKVKSAWTQPPLAEKLVRQQKDDTIKSLEARCSQLEKNTIGFKEQLESMENKIHFLNYKLRMERETAAKIADQQAIADRIQIHDISILKGQLEVSEKEIDEKEKSKNRTLDKICELGRLQEIDREDHQRERSRLQKQCCEISARLKSSQELLEESNDSAIKQMYRHQSDSRLMQDALKSKDKYADSWIESTLKLKFIFDKMFQIHALPEDQSEWVYPMVDDITIPDVSSLTRAKYLPSHLDAHMVFVDSEEESEIYARLSEEASIYSDLLYDPTDIDEAVMIQKIFRGYKCRLELARIISRCDPTTEEGAATVIQKIYRGWNSRGIQVHSGMGRINGFRYGSTHTHIPDNTSITFVTTGQCNYRVTWMRGPQRPASTSNIIKPGLGAGFTVSTYGGHWFVADKEDAEGNIGGTAPIYLRVPFNLKSGGVFDINTQITINREFRDRAWRTIAAAGVAAAAWVETGHVYRAENSDADDADDSDAFDLGWRPDDLVPGETEQVYWAVMNSINAQGPHGPFN